MTVAVANQSTSMGMNPHLEKSNGVDIGLLPLSAHWFDIRSSKVPSFKVLQPGKEATGPNEFLSIKRRGSRRSFGFSSVRACEQPAICMPM